jgi:hypothetical protein
MSRPFLDPALRELEENAGQTAVDPFVETEKNRDSMLPSGVKGAVASLPKQRSYL